VFELIGEGKLVGIKKRGWETGNTTIVMLPKLRLLQERERRRTMRRVVGGTRRTARARGR
jgi:hypothetical protein